MSEPCSFILRVSIEKEQYLKFMQATPSEPKINQNWLNWWDSRDMYGGKLEFPSEVNSWAHYPSNKSIVDEWLSLKDTMAFSSYDEVEGVWDFGIIFCCENFYEILPLLFFCESVAAYKSFCSKDFSIVYPYFWGDESVMAYMIFEEGVSTLHLASSTVDIAKEHMDYAVSKFDEKWDELSGLYSMG